MNFLWIDLECCTTANYIIATCVKTLLLLMKYIVPLVFICLSVVKFTSKKRELRKNRVKKVTLYIVVAIVSMFLGFLIDFSLDKAEPKDSEKQTWIECYQGVCKAK